MPDKDAIPYDFSELCQQARQIEKGLIEPEGKKLTDSLSYGEHSEIFPKEFESYTYFFLQSEAQKIEKKLFASGFRQAMAVPIVNTGSEVPSEEKEIEDELHRFATVPPGQPAPALQEEKITPPSSAKKSPFGFSLPKFGMPQLIPKVKETPEAAPAPPPQPATLDESSLYVAKSTEEEAEKLRPQPFAEEAQLPIAGQQKKTAMQQEEPPPAAFEGGLETEGEPPLPEEQQELAAPSEDETAGEGGKADSASRLSPKLRALIEAKLKKEDEKARLASEEVEPPPYSPSAAAPEKPPEQQSPMLSSRERRISRMQKMGAQQPSQEEGHSDEPAAAPPRAKRKMGAEELLRGMGPKETQEDEPDLAKEKEAPGEVEPEHPEEFEGGQPEEPLPPVAKLQEKARKPPPAQVEEEAPEKTLQQEPDTIPRGAPAGKITIRPIFPSTEKGAPTAEPKESERLAKITRIVEQLSPDKYKAAAIRQPPPQEEEAKPAYRQKMRAPPEQEEEAKPAYRGKTPPPQQEQEAQRAYRGKTPPPQQEQEEEEAQPDYRKKSRTLPAQLAPSKKKRVLPPPVEEEQEPSPARRVLPGAKLGARQPVLPQRKPSLAPEPRPRQLPTRAAPKKSAATSKERVLPGGRVQQRPTTYVPPSRSVMAPRLAVRQEEEPRQQRAEQARPAIASEKEEEPAQTEPSYPRQIQLPKAAQRAQEPPPQEDEREELEAEAPLPPKEKPSEELDVPLPPKPAQADYEGAKEEFRAKMEEEEVKQKARQESDQLIEQYAKDNLVWLYEIYKMGGIAREDFLQKVEEKMKEGSEPEPAPPENPALAAIGKEIEKRSKK